MQLALQIADSTAASGISAMNFVISLEHGEYSWNEGAQCHLFWLQSSLHRWNHPETPFAMAAAENLPVGYSKTHKQQQKKKEKQPPNHIRHHLSSAHISECPPVPSELQEWTSSSSSTEKAPGRDSAAPALLQ